MNRTTWLQDRRMKKFLDVLSRFEHRELSTVEAGELLGCSERQFLRHRRCYEEEGLDGLLDKRLGRLSAKRVPVDVVEWRATKQSERKGITSNAGFEPTIYLPKESACSVQSQRRNISSIGPVAREPERRRSSTVRTKGAPIASPKD